MLRISMIAVGNKMPKWVEAGYEEYAKRIHGRVHLNLIEISAEKRSKNADIARIIVKEENKIRDCIVAGEWVIALDRNGKSWSTMALAHNLQRWIERGQNIALVIGGPEGLSDYFLNQADEVRSLSELTFAHQLVRVMVAEQLYRCFSILEGAPYHR